MWLRSQRFAATLVTATAAIPRQFALSRVRGEDVEGLAFSHQWPALARPGDQPGPRLRRRASYSREAKVIRTIGDPELRFTEDKLRMLCAVRFAARFGFGIESATMAAIQKLAPQTAPEAHQVSRERVRDELTKMLTEGHARDAFLLLDESGLLREVLPEISAMKGVQQPPQFHPEGDVFVHTLLLLQNLPHPCSPALAWGALLHDVGKPATFRASSNRWDPF